MSREPIIQLRDIRKSYWLESEQLEILKGVSLEIQPGEFVAIMGPSGSGKSTLMNILGLLDVPTSGSFQLQGREISKLGEDDLAVVRRSVIGFVFQQFNLLPRLSAKENVALPLLYSQRTLDFTKSSALLEKVGLGSRLDHRPNQLSGGQQQRVAIARSLVNQPLMILADEPTGNLDSKSSEEILSILKNLNEQGITVVLVTHEMEVAEQAQRIILIRDGVIQSDERKHSSPPQVLPQSPERPPSSFWFEFFEHFKQGVQTLVANKVRTFLSMLGILIGVAAVIAMLALGTGAQLAIERQLSSLGSNLLILRPGPIRLPGAGGSESGALLRLTMEDSDALAREISAVKYAAPAIESGGSQQAAFGDRNWSTRLMGVSALYPNMHAAQPEIGRFFTFAEDQSRALVAVIGMTVVRELFQGQNPIGKTIKVNKINLTVIGILPEKGSTGFRDQDDVVVVPVRTAMYRLIGKKWVDYIELEIKEPGLIDQAQSQVEEVMRSRRTIPPSQQDDAFSVRNMADLQTALSQSNKTMSLLLASIAGISLLVGGIGIMNIMLVSVTERTREIGLRKAIGARRRDILSQFLIEAAVVGVVGGLMGVLIGVSISLLLSHLAGWTTAISWKSVCLSFGFSVAIGVIFGLWPARKASLLNPIEALRYE